MRHSVFSNPASAKERYNVRISTVPHIRIGSPRSEIPGAQKLVAGLESEYSGTVFDDSGDDDDEIHLGRFVLTDCAQLG